MQPVQVLLPIARLQEITRPRTARLREAIPPTVRRQEAILLIQRLPEATPPIVLLPEAVRLLIRRRHGAAARPLPHRREAPEEEHPEARDKKQCIRFRAIAKGNTLQNNKFWGVFRFDGSGILSV